MTIQEGQLSPRSEIAAPEAILATPIEHRDDVANTIGDYLVALLRQLWSEGVGFDTKRPFGFSGWRTAIARGLVDAGYVQATFSSSGAIVEYDEDAANRSVLAAIDALHQPGGQASGFMGTVDEPDAESPANQLGTVSASVAAAHAHIRSAVRVVRSDVLLTEETVSYLEHAEAELREAVNRLAGARFAIEALARKQGAL